MSATPKLYVTAKRHKNAVLSGNPVIAVTRLNRGDNEATPEMLAVSRRIGVQFSYRVYSDPFNPESYEERTATYPFGSYSLPAPESPGYGKVFDKWVQRGTDLGVTDGSALNWDVREIEATWLMPIVFEYDLHTASEQYGLGVVGELVAYGPEPMMMLGQSGDVSGNNGQFPVVRYYNTGGAYTYGYFIRRADMESGIYNNQVDPGYTTFYEGDSDVTINNGVPFVTLYGVVFPAKAEMHYVYDYASSYFVDYAGWQSEYPAQACSTTTASMNSRSDFSDPNETCMYTTVLTQGNYYGYIYMRVECSESVPELTGYFFVGYDDYSYGNYPHNADGLTYGYWYGNWYDTTGDMGMASPESSDGWREPPTLYIGDTASERYVTMGFVPDEASRQILQDRGITVTLKVQVRMG